MRIRALGAMLSFAAAMHLTVVAVPAFAQQPKAAPAKPAQGDLIAKGQQLFEDQQYEESIQTLSAALVRPTNTTQQKVEIYRLLALNYITLGRKDEAESAVRGLLVISPDYQLPPSESPRFRDFFTATRKKWEDEGRPGLVKDKPPEKPIVIKQAAPSSVDAGQSIDIAGKVEDPDGKVKSLKIYYRAGSKDDFTEADVDRNGDGFRIQIPGTFAKAPLLEYYLAGLDDKGEAIATRGDSQSPLRIAVTEPSKGWVLPVAIGGGILGAAAIVGGLALAGVFKGSSGGGTNNGGNKTGTVTVNVGEAGFRFR
jgi:hypothetical protein